MNVEADVKPLIIVVGATASGKSGLAIELAQRLDGEVINADSMQLYRGMDIGTAKVTGSEQQGVPHHLLDVLDVTEEASVAAYQKQARRSIEQIRGRGRVPILVGGSGLYVRAVVDIIEFPPTDPEVRAIIADRLSQDGPAVLREELRISDPESAAIIRDDRRLVRALEVVHLTGRTFTSFMPRRLHEPSIEPAMHIGLTVARDVLHKRIETRVHRMRGSGLLEEVSRLDALGLRNGRTARQAIGYQQFLRVLDQRLSIDQATQDTIIATRKFARRQQTWFRADPRIHWLEAQGDKLSEQAVEAIHSQIG